jgi:hypothetical protein
MGRLVGGTEKGRHEVWFDTVQLATKRRPAARVGVRANAANAPLESGAIAHSGGAKRRAVEPLSGEDFEPRCRLA